MSVNKSKNMKPDLFQAPDYYQIDDLLTEEHKLVREAAREWVKRDVSPIIEEYAQNAKFPKQIIKGLADIGAFGPYIPEEYGGAGLDQISYGLIMQEIERGDSMVKRKLPIPSKTAKVRDIVEFYLYSDSFARLAGRTQKKYETEISKAIATVVEGKALGDYKARTLKARHTNQAYQKWLVTGTHTANYRKATLSAAWKHNMRLDVVQHDPVALIKMEVTYPRRVKWTREQVRDFMTTAYSDFRWRSIGLIVHMAYEWAQRVGDMRTLTWDDVDLDAQRIDLKQSKRGAEVHLPIPDELLAMLEAQRVDFGFQDYVAPRVKPNHSGYSPYTAIEIHTQVNNIKAKAGLDPKLQARDLRRTAITEMAEAGVDLVGIMQVSGHQSPNSVKPYLVNTFSGASAALSKRRGDG